MPTLLSPGVLALERDLTTTIPGVSTSVGGIAGVFLWGPVDQVTLVSDENQLINRFGKPSNFNAETFFTAANFLSYSNSLLVVRVANTTHSTGALNAVGNTGTTNVVACVVKNREHYDTIASFNANTLYIAKYPGELGNSLRVSVCDSETAYESNLNLIGTQGGDNINGQFKIDSGSNVAVLTFVSSGSVSNANTFANNQLNKLSVNDIITIGNSTIGLQYLKVSNIGVPATNATHAFANIEFSGINKLIEDYVVSNTVNGNTTVANVKRNWEFFNIVDGAPKTSSYVEDFGNTAAKDLLHIVVVDENGQFTGVKGTILEIFQDLSRATDAKKNDGTKIYYKDVINDSSQYIWFANHRAGAPSANALNITTSTNTKPLNLTLNSGTNGSDESSISITILSNGYDLFKNKENVDVSLIMAGKPRGGTNGTQLANYIIDNIVEIRKDCIVFVSPPDNIITSNKGDEVNALLKWRNDMRDTTYAVLDTGYKYIYDRYNDVYRYVPLNGDIAGLVARTDATNDPWWSPAGFNRGKIKNIIKLRYNPDQAARDFLYKNSINPVVTFPGTGTILYGDKTATVKPSAFGDINVRRLFIVLQKAISTAAKYSLFEFNDEFTRAQFVNMISPYLRDVQSRKGIYDYLVVCDETNNTPERIDKKEFWADIYIKPARSINYIILRFTAVKTGVEFSTIVGQ